MAAAPGRLEVIGTRIFDDQGKPWRGAGVNWHWAGLRESTLTYPTHAQIDNVLNEVASFGPAGSIVVRGHTLGVSFGLSKSLVTGLNPDGSLVWNEAAWEPIDYVIAGARARGIRLSIPFTDIHDFYHRGRGDWVKWAFIQRATSGIPSTYTYGPDGAQTTETGVISYNPPANAGFSGSARAKAITQQYYRLPWLRAAQMAYVRGWFGHVNQFTGIRHADEPAVAFVQGGNEMWDSGDEYRDHAGADGIAWAAEFSATVAQVAPNVLVVDSQGADGANLLNAPGRNDPNTHIVDNHAYNNHNPYGSGYVAGLAAKAELIGKPLFLGEYTFNRSGIAVFLDEVERNPGVAMAQWWAIYTPDEGHTPGSSDDSVYVVGQSNGGFKSVFQAHAAAMATGNPPAPPVNLLRSATVANSEASATLYESGSADGANPVLVTEPSVGVSGSALRATATGPGHKWVFVDMDASLAAPVTPGVTYTAAAHVQLASGALTSGWYGHITWLRPDGTYLSGATSTSTVSTSSSYQQVTCTAVAPTGAGYAVPQIEFDGPASSSAGVRIDQWGIFAGQVASPWTPPQVAPMQVVRAEKVRFGASDGGLVVRAAAIVFGTAVATVVGAVIRAAGVRFGTQQSPSLVNVVRAGNIRFGTTTKAPSLYWKADGKLVAALGAFFKVGGRLVQVLGAPGVDTAPAPTTPVDTDVESDVESDTF